MHIWRNLYTSNNYFEHCQEGGERKITWVLGENKTTIGLTISNIRGISLLPCMHKILIEENFEPIIKSQWRLNPNMKEVVRAEVVKLLDPNIIYLISNSA